MRQTSIIIILLAFLSCRSQDNKKELKIPEVGWTLYIPTDSKLLATAQFDTLFKRTAVNAMNKAYGIKEEEFKELKPLFTIRKGQFDILGSTLNPYDSSVYKTWQESYAASKILIIDLINKQGGQVKIVDTASSKEIIDGLSFEKFYIKTIYPSQNLTMNTYWWYRKHGNYDFSINTTYADDAMGKQYLDIIQQSKFDK